MVMGFHNLYLLAIAIYLGAWIAHFTRGSQAPK